MENVKATCACGIRRATIENHDGVGCMTGYGRAATAPQVWDAPDAGFRKDGNSRMEAA